VVKQPLAGVPRTLSKVLPVIEQHIDEYPEGV
jgi:hypothetical protein